MSELSVTTLKHESATSDNITLASNGNVGIGTNSPAHKLDISGTAYGGVYIKSTSTNFSGMLIENTNSATKWQVGVEGGAYIGAGTFNIGIDAVGSRLAIDSSGRVTMPYQPAFNVTSTVSLASQNVWTYNTTYVNIGGHMNISNGRFTAPVAGTYVFFFGTIGQTTHSDSDIYLQKNGTNTQQGVARPDDSGAWASMGAGTGIMTLSAGDYIAVYSVPGNSYSDSNQWLHFRGYLLG